MPAIDGLRGIAILLVLWYHGPFIFQDVLALPAPGFGRMSTAGWIGVDLFFVVSGFLITSILLKTRHNAGQLGTFWARRSLRILPLAFLYLCFVAIQTSFSGPWRVQEGFADWPWYFGYLANFHIARNGFQPMCVMILWSLAVEEHFYLFWPIVVRACTPRRLLSVCLAIMVAAPLFRALVGQYPAAYVLTFCRFDSLAAGAILAVLLGDQRWRAATLNWSRRLLLPALGVLAIVLLTPYSPSFSTTHPIGFTIIGYSLIAAAFAVVVGASISIGPSAAAIIWNAPLRFVGRLCYGYYIWHCVVGLLVGQLAESYAPGVLAYSDKVVVWGVALTLVACLSWHGFERPVLRLKRFFPHGASARRAQALPSGDYSKGVAASHADPSPKRQRGVLEDSQPAIGYGH